MADSLAVGSATSCQPKQRKSETAKRSYDFGDEKLISIRAVTTLIWGTLNENSCKF
jgi:hypothetical protein